MGRATEGTYVSLTLSFPLFPAPSLVSFPLHSASLRSPVHRLLIGPVFSSFFRLHCPPFLASPFLRSRFSRAYFVGSVLFLVSFLVSVSFPLSSQPRSSPISSRLVWSRGRRVVVPRRIWCPATDLAFRVQRVRTLSSSPRLLLREWPCVAIVGGPFCLPRTSCSPRVCNPFAVVVPHFPFALVVCRLHVAQCRVLRHPRFVAPFRWRVLCSSFPILGSSSCAQWRRFGVLRVAI